MRVKYTFEDYVFLSVLRTGCYDKQTKSKEFFNPELVTYTGAQVNSTAIANICLFMQAVFQVPIAF